MELAGLFRDIWGLNSGERRVTYNLPESIAITALRTDKVCSHDFAVGLVYPNRAEFFPTHVRLLFNLYLQRTSNWDGFLKVMEVMDRVYDGQDPLAESERVSRIAFPLQLDPPMVSLCLAQMLMLEQEFNYGPLGCKTGRVQPPREFLMRFIRWIADPKEEVDRVVSTAVRNYPPPVRLARKGPPSAAAAVLAGISPGGGPRPETPPNIRLGSQP